MSLPERKPTRLRGYDYSSPGAYFITLCVKDGKELLSHITVGDDVGIVPYCFVTPKTLLVADDCIAIYT